MCDRLHWGEDTIETMGELRERLPIVVFHNDVNICDYPGDHLCLCGVDLPETGRVNGVDIFPEPDGSGGLTGDFLVYEMPSI